jgi:hypothetical protein
MVRSGYGSRRVIRGKGACSGSVSRSTILDHFVHDWDRSRHLASASEPDEDCAACWHSAALFAHSAALIIVVTPQEATEPSKRTSTLGETKSICGRFAQSAEVMPVVHSTLMLSSLSSDN